MKIIAGFLSVFILILLLLSNICMVESLRVPGSHRGSVNYFTRYSSHEFYAHRSPPPVAVVGGDDGDEIDPRYGVEKRMVPTGPNPLHH